jgi:hypothetical protein
LSRKRADTASEANGGKADQCESVSGSPKHEGSRGVPVYWPAIYHEKKLIQPRTRIAKATATDKGNQATAVIDRPKHVIRVA